jgi:phosphoribosylaminoimidazole-succinocarboxamide synthase
VTGAKTKKLALSYEGSVKHVWEASDEPESLWFEFSDDYSVFDWGKMPDKIDHKGRALALIGAFFFEQLKTPEFWASLPESISTCPLQQSCFLWSPRTDHEWSANTLQVTL